MQQVGLARSELGNQVELCLMEDALLEAARVNSNVSQYGEYMRYSKSQKIENEMKASQKLSTSRTRKGMPHLTDKILIIMTGDEAPETIGGNIFFPYFFHGDSKPKMTDHQH
jgi:hypothetical protein